jgi:hypothetical protein
MLCSLIGKYERFGKNLSTLLRVHGVIPVGIKFSSTHHSTDLIKDM